MPLKIGTKGQDPIEIPWWIIFLALPGLALSIAGLTMGTLHLANDHEILHQVPGLIQAHNALVAQLTKQAPQPGKSTDAPVSTDPAR